MVYAAGFCGMTGWLFAGLFCAFSRRFAGPLQVIGSVQRDGDTGPYEGVCYDAGPLIRTMVPRAERPAKEGSIKSPVPESEEGHFRSDVKQLENTIQTVVERAPICTFLRDEILSWMHRWVHKPRTKII